MKKISAFCTVIAGLLLSACDVTVEQMTPEDSRIYRETKLVREEIREFNKRADNTIEEQMQELCGDPLTLFRMDSVDLDKLLASAISCRKEHYQFVMMERKEELPRLREIRKSLLVKAEDFNQTYWVSGIPEVKDEVKRYKRLNDRLHERLLRIVMERSSESG